MSSEQTDPGDEPPLDALLGQPRMVSDPRISVAQAAQILGKTRAQVYRMVNLGRLRRRGEPNKFRGLLLSDVLQCRERGDPIEVADAAKVLGCTASDVRRLVAEGKLMLVPGSQRLLYRTDVHKLSRTWIRPARAKPQQPDGPKGHINTAAAARLLGLSVSRTRHLAASERIPASRDSMGRYWYHPGQLELVRRAWQTAEEDGRR
jgi:excisionase family DNA binding protein